MTVEIPEYYNDLDGSIHRAWELLADGADRRQSPMHILTIASIDEHQQPSQRIMVLREASLRKRGLRFHTDIRSDKIREFGDSPENAKAVSILAYHADARVQLRLSGKAWSEYDSATADDAWHSSTNFARRCYLTQHAPGKIMDAPTSGLPEDIEGIKPDDAQVAPARENFGILLAEINQVEWLYLANAGHRRAKFIWNKNAQSWDGQWLVP